MYDIITCGSSTIDAFVKTDTKSIDYRKKDHGKIIKEHLIGYPTGAKILIDHLEFMTGGGGTNTAVSFSRLGLKTAYLGNIGNDGKRILDELKKEKVDFVGTKASVPSGFSVVLDSNDDDRTILTYKGPNSNLDFKSIVLSKLKTKWFYFSSMTGKSFKTIVKLAAYAKQKKRLVAFNPSLYQAKLGTKKLRPMLKNVDVLILNKEEAAALLGMKLIDGYKRSAMVHVLEMLRSLGPKITIVTDGKKGAYASNGMSFFIVKAPKVKVLETTGAGDAFASGFIAGLMKLDDISDALRLGAANAKSVIEHYGAKNKLLSLTAGKRLLRSVKVSVSVLK